MKKALIGIEWEPQLTLLEYPNLPVDVLSGAVGSILSTYMRITADERRVRLLIRDGCYDKYRVPIYPHYHYSISTDTVKHLLEVRTFPVALDELESQINICNDHLGDLLSRVKQYTPGGIGVFLPKARLGESDGIGFHDEQDVYRLLEYSTPSKHVSISFRSDNFPSQMQCQLLGSTDPLACYLHTSDEYNSYDEFRSLIKLRMSTVDYGHRLHITVPYNFNDYSRLAVYAWKLWQTTNDNWAGPYMKMVKFINSWYKKNEPAGPLLVGYIKNKNYVSVGGLI